MSFYHIVQNCSSIVIPSIIKNRFNSLTMYFCMRTIHHVILIAITRLDIQHRLKTHHVTLDHVAEVRSCDLFV